LNDVGRLDIASTTDFRFNVGGGVSQVFLQVYFMSFSKGQWLTLKVNIPVVTTIKIRVNSRQR